MNKTKVLFVCMGNICRSPSAQGVFEKLLADQGLKEQFEVDSAGTHSYHVGSLPDSRSIECAEKRGIDLTNQRARKVKSRDFERFDRIVAMDNDNLKNLQNICPQDKIKTLSTMMSYAPQSRYNEVPDPYYGGYQGFDLVLDLLETANKSLLEELIATAEF